ncbi:hypothetical protein T4B_2951 [Trichinella pseudospiralis]|uniref:F-box domain-containing protein n=1 Tax=Trichinella pseudospiralis TaxID=6337 RepID=A0A0V1H0Q6_TRIPS|nr:hypothetical protein T4B_2951 [Trichinella pseudospiralis]
MDASSNTIIADMPEDILKKIFSYVDQYEGLKTCSCVCRRWKVLSDHILKIRDHYLRRGINLRWNSIVPRAISKLTPGRDGKASRMLTTSGRWFANCPCLLMETVVELVKQLDTGEQDELLKLFMHHASGT